MRLGISTLLVVALASASLVACGDSETGAGGGGGAGGGATGSGGDDTVTGTGGGTGGEGGAAPEECLADVVADVSECDAGCDANVVNLDDGAVFCTYSCTVDTDCSDDGSAICYAVGDSSSCVLACDGDNACPNTQDYTCEQTDLVCLPIAS